MRVFFSGIGGVGIGPLAMIAQDLGFKVTGTSAEPTPITRELATREVDIEYQTSDAHLQAEHFLQPIDWLVYSSGIPQDHPELSFAREHGIRTSKRDEFINEILQVASLRMVAVAGTHGKTTTTAMVTWLFKQLARPVSYSIGSQIGFGSTGAYEKSSEFFVYECDEYDRNFLHFHPYLSAITNISHDHPDTYPSPKDYDEAFRTFADQSDSVMTWEEVAAKLTGRSVENVSAQSSKDPRISKIQLAGTHNRQNAWLAVQVVLELTGEPLERLVELVSQFPGTARRFEKLAENIYTDYAHHPDEIRATLELARELNDHVIVVYQPHQNIRQHAVIDGYKTAFQQAAKVYWTPTYLTREDPDLAVITPDDFLSKIPGTEAEAADLTDDLAAVLAKDAAEGKLVLIMGAGPIDDWARQQFAE